MLAAVVFRRALASRPNVAVSHAKRLSAAQSKAAWPLLPNKQSCLTIHTSNVRPALPPVVIALIKPMSRIAAVVIGRRFRKWWKNIDEEKAAKIKDTSRKYSHAWGALGFFLFSLGVYGYQSHVEECPITKRKRFVALTEAQMKKISGQEFKQLLEGLEEQIVPTNQQVYSRVANVAKRIIAGNQDIQSISGKEWTVTVVKDDEKNAFVLPSGNIFVYTGMLEVCTNDDQLGTILSHEMAHAVLNHGAEALSHANLVSLILIVPLAVLWGLMPNDGIALVADWFFNTVSSLILELPFSRELETEADKVGLELAAKACFDVREAAAFWRKMEFLSTQDPNEIKVPEYLSTHPSHVSRHEELLSMMPWAISKRTECKCGQLLGPDPDKMLAQMMSVSGKKTSGKAVSVVEPA